MSYFREYERCCRVVCVDSVANLTVIHFATSPEHSETHIR